MGRNMQVLRTWPHCWEALGFPFQQLFGMPDFWTGNTSFSPEAELVVYRSWHPIQLINRGMWAHEILQLKSCHGYSENRARKSLNFSPETVIFQHFIIWHRCSLWAAQGSYSRWTPWCTAARAEVLPAAWKHGFIYVILLLCLMGQTLLCSFSHRGENFVSRSSKEVRSGMVSHTSSSKFSKETFFRSPDCNCDSLQQTTVVRKKTGFVSYEFQWVLVKLVRSAPQDGARWILLPSGFWERRNKHILNKDIGFINAFELLNLHRNGHAVWVVHWQRNPLKSLDFSHDSTLPASSEKA